MQLCGSFGGWLAKYGHSGLHDSGQSSSGKPIFSLAFVGWNSFPVIVPGRQDTNIVRFAQPAIKKLLSDSVTATVTATATTYLCNGVSVCYSELFPPRRQAGQKRHGSFVAAIREPRTRSECEVSEGLEVLWQRYPVRPDSDFTKTGTGQHAIG